MKFTLVLRDKKNALKLSTKSIESFVERIKHDTKDGAVARRRKQLRIDDYMEAYDRQYPTHMIYPSAEFEKDENDNLRMKTFNGVVALTIDGLESQTEIDAVKQAAQILHYTLASFVGPSDKEVIILVKVAKADAAYPKISGASSPISGTSAETSGTYLDEEEADKLCREGHRMATAIYQGILPRSIRQETYSVRSCFHMPLDAQPYLNMKALALPVSAKPLNVSPMESQIQVGSTIEATDDESQTVSREDSPAHGLPQCALPVPLQYDYGIHGIQG